MTRFFKLLPFACLLAAPLRAEQKPPGLGEIFREIIHGEKEVEYRTRVRISGTKTMSENDALALIGDRLEHVRRQAPSASRASDAAFMTRQLFRNQGYNYCEVTWKITDGSSIQLVVNEGPRQELGDVKVTGVDSDTAKRLAKLYAVPAEKRRFGAGERPPFREIDVDEGLALVVSDFHSRGYWTAKAEVKDRKFDTKKGGKVNILIETQPGPLHRISAPTIEGAGGNRDGVAQEAAAFTNLPADTGNVNGLRSAIETYYRKRGFTKAKVLMTSTITDGKFVPGLIIDEGKSYQLGRITFDGLVKTKSWRIRQRISDLEGKTLDDTVMEKRLRGMMATGAFQAVRTEQIPRGEDVMDATLHFEEGEARGYTLSAGLGSYEGPIGGVAYYDRNFMGLLYNFSSGFEMSARSILGEVSLSDPWLWGTDATGTARLFLLTRDNEGYSTWKAGLEGGVLYPVTPHYTLDGRVGWSFVNTNSEDIPGTQLGETVYQNPYIRINQRIDYRDSAVLPTKGWKIEVPIEFGSAVGQVSTIYTKAEVAGAWYHPIGKKGLVALAARGGVIVANGDDFDLPIDMRFFLGGANTVRSYAEREMGPHSRSGYPLGGEAYWVTNAEYIHSMGGALKLVGFVDAGALSQRGGGAGSASDPDIAAGLGIRFDLPIGPVRFEYGHNLTKDPGEPSGAWHFSIGTTF
ncbi:MAG: BamA/TamA family outer membrane protein [Luteolibacter sp.]